MSELWDRAVAGIRERLNFHGVHYELERATIRVPVGGDVLFEVAMVDDRDELTVHAGPWHEHCEDPEQAVAAFMWPLTPFYMMSAVHCCGRRALSRALRWASGGWTDVTAPVCSLHRDLIAALPIARAEDWTETTYQHMVVRPEFDCRTVEPESILSDGGLPVDLRLGEHTVTCTPEEIARFMEYWRDHLAPS